MPQDSDGAYVVEEQEYGEVLDSLKIRLPAANGRPGGNGRHSSPAVLPSAQRPAPASPPLAATLSLFVPGSGQVYNREAKLGAALFLTLALVGIGHWSALTLWPSLRETVTMLGIQRGQILFTAFAVDFLSAFLFLWGIHQAYAQAEANAGAFPGINIPLLPALASLLIPGWGQIANGQIGKALFFIAGLIPGAFGLALLTLPIVADPASISLHADIGLSLEDAAIGGVGLSAILWLLSTYDAGLVSRFRHASS